MKGKEINKKEEGIKRQGKHAKQQEEKKAHYQNANDAGAQLKGRVCVYGKEFTTDSFYNF